MPRKDNDRQPGIPRAATEGRGTDLGLLLMALIWGVNFPVIKAALQEVPPLAFNALRFPLASFTVFLLLRAGGPVSWPRREDVPSIIGLGLLGNVVYQGLFIFGIDNTLAGNASILLATIPIWTVILSTLARHERSGARVWVGITATVAGMVLVVLGGHLAVGMGSGNFRGDLMMVGAALTWAAYTVLSKPLVQRYGPSPVAAWTLWVGTPVLVVGGIPSLSRLHLPGVSTAAWAGVAYAGALAIGLAYVLWNRGIRAIGSSRTAAYQNLTPVVALLVAWVWLGEVPTGLQIGGAAVVLAGVSLARAGGPGRAEGSIPPGRGNTALDRKGPAPPP